MRAQRFLSSEKPVLIAVIGLCLMIAVLLDRIDRNRLDYAAREQAGRIGVEDLQTVTTQLNNMAIGLGRLVTAAEMLPDLNPAAFETIAARLVRDLEATGTLVDHDRSPVLSISVAPDLVVEHVYPSEGNRAFLGMDYRQLPGQIEDVEAVLGTTTPLVSRPFLAVQGQRAIAVRQRITGPDGRVLGIASVAIDLDLLSEQLARQTAQGSDHRVGFFVDGFGGLGDQDVFRLDPYILDLHTRNMAWTIAVLPQDGWPTLPLLTPTRVIVPLVTLVLLWLVRANHQRNLRQRKKERRLEKGIDALSAGFVIFDENDQLIHWNETYRDLFGYGTILRKGITLQELLKSGLRQGIFKVDQTSEEAWIALNVDNHRRAGGSVDVEMADGRWIKVLSRRTEDGDLVGVRFDITDLKRAQFEAERLSRAKSEMISVMSHELRTPLTTILGFGRLLALKPPQVGDKAQDAFTKDAIDRIVAAGENLLRLINEMLDYVNLGAAAPVAAQDSCNLRDVIGQTASRLETAAAQRGVSLQVSSPNVAVRADPARVAQIVENLVSNAVKFTSTGGTVRVSARTEEEFAFVTIADDGPGIPQDKQKAIFEEFSQLAPSGQRREGGIGLGLARTKRLVELQGGKIAVQSAPGEGSTFTFSLPLPSLQLV